MKKYYVTYYGENTNKFSVSGPCVGPDASIGKWACVYFDKKEDAEKAALIADAAYRAGRRNLQDQLKECLTN